MARTKRINGFQRPFTNDQVLSWVAEPVAALLFFLWTAAFAPAGPRAALLAVFAVLLVVHLAAWLRCSLPDPAEDKGMAWPCMRTAQEESRYCAVCQKNVPGLDHHCTWLNTCIGKRQYPAFFALVMVGTVMYWLEFGVFVALLTTWRTPEVEAKAVEVFGSLVTYKVLLSLSAAFAGALAVGLSVLATFHTFLQFTGMGTYAWMIDSRTKKVERKRAKLEKERAAAAAETGAGASTSSSTSSTAGPGATDKAAKGGACSRTRDASEDQSVATV